MTGADLAKRVGVTPAHISKLESARGEPSVAVLRRIGKALAVDLELLVGADDGS
jgi:transcriptional regulator with XRE-family HTH domain